MKIVILVLLKTYKRFFSPLLVNLFGHSCKFTPTCSDYTYQAFEKFGVMIGFLLSVKRLLRCNPFSKGGFDPVTYSA